MQTNTPARRADALANRERIIQAAQALFAERGLDVEISEIAERAGVGVGTLYRHYANRDDLLRAIIDKSFDDAFTELRNTAAIEDPIEALRALPLTAVAIQCRLGYLQGVMHDPRLIKLFKEKHEHGEQMFGQVMQLMAELFDRGVRAGVFRADLDRDMVAIAILGSIGPAIKHQMGTRPLDEFAGALADFFIAIFTKQ